MHACLRRRMPHGNAPAARWHARSQPRPVSPPHPPQAPPTTPNQSNRLFESVSPLLPDVAGRLSADLSPFCSVGAGMRFSAADEAAGGWRNFFVGLVGGVAAHEDDILWPNQVCRGCCFPRVLLPCLLPACAALGRAGRGGPCGHRGGKRRGRLLAHTHARAPSSSLHAAPQPLQALHRDRVLCNVRNGWLLSMLPLPVHARALPMRHAAAPLQVLHRDRVLYNVRNGWDVARFLADPRKEDMVEHRWVVVVLIGLF